MRAARVLSAVHLLSIALAVLSPSASAATDDRLGCAYVDLRDSGARSTIFRVTTDTTITSPGAACVDETVYYMTAGGSGVSVNCEAQRNALSTHTSPQFVGLYLFKRTENTDHGAQGTTNWASPAWSTSYTGANALTDCDGATITISSPSLVGYYRLVVRICNDTTCTDGGVGDYDVSSDGMGDAGGGTLSSTSRGLFDSRGEVDPLTVFTGTDTYYPGERVEISVLARLLDGTQNTGQSANILVDIKGPGFASLVTDQSVTDRSNGLYSTTYTLSGSAQPGDYYVFATLSTTTPGATMFRVRTNDSAVIASLSSDVATLLSRLTATRAGNLDEIPKASAAAQSAEKHLNVTTDVEVRRAIGAAQYGNSNWNTTYVAPNNAEIVKASAAAQSAERHLNLTTDPEVRRAIGATQYGNARWNSTYVAPNNAEIVKASAAAQSVEAHLNATTDPEIRRALGSIQYGNSKWNGTYASPPDTAAIRSAVWGASRADYGTAGTFGAALQTSTVDLVSEEEFRVFANESLAGSAQQSSDHRSIENQTARSIATARDRLLESDEETRAFLPWKHYANAWDEYRPRGGTHVMVASVGAMALSASLWKGSRASPKRRAQLFLIGLAGIVAYAYAGGFLT